MEWEDFKIIVIFAVIVVLIFGAMFFVDSMVCTAKTKDMGFNHNYSILGGCKIEVNPGQWIPLDSYYFKQE